ncbi:MAG: alpha/beta fold hydrolase [Pseudomonadota bacterium]
MTDWRSMACTALIVLCAVLGAEVTAAQSEPTRFSSPVFIDMETGDALAAEQGFLQVPQNRKVAGSPTIAVPYLRIKSTAAEPGTPIFWLAGGPGSSHMQRIVGPDVMSRRASSDWSVIRRYIEDFTSVADMVVIDQRGTGFSYPYVNCPVSAEVDPPLQEISEAAMAPAIADFAQRCKAALEAGGIDVRGYHVLELADDVDALRASLGYDKISVFGGSFGSQWTFSLLRRHPEIIERVMLWGIENVVDTYDKPSGTLQSLREILAEAPPLGDTGMDNADAYLQAIGELIAELDANPEKITVDGRTVLATGDVIRQNWRRGSGSRARMSEWYNQLAAALDGGRDAVAALAKMASGNLGYSQQGPTGMYFSIDCGLMPPMSRVRAYRNDPAVALLGNINLTYDSVCPVWNSPQPGDDFMAPISSDIPALFVHGTWDTSTPLGNAEAVLSEFNNAHLIVVEGGTHGVVDDLYRENPDLIRPILRDFLAGRPVGDLPDRVRLPALAIAAEGQ